MQNAAAKLILGGRKRDHATPFLQELHWLPVSQRHIFKTVLLVYKTLQGDGPLYLQDLLKPYSCDRDGMRLADDITRLDEPTTQYKTFGDRAFSVFGSKMWNMLPTLLRTSGCPLQLLHSKLPLKPIFFKLHIRKYSFRHILLHLNAYYTNNE